METESCTVYYSHYYNPVNPERFHPKGTLRRVYTNGNSEEEKVIEWTENRFLVHFYENEVLVATREDTFERVEIPK